MADQRKDGKLCVTFWATKEEKKMLKEAAKLAGFASLADYLRWIAEEQPRPGELPDIPPPTSKKRGVKEV